MTTKAAIYLRVSTDEQATDGYGLAAQREKCQAMATVKGWPVAAEYADEGISGSKGPDERPGLAALLAAACGGEIDAVIVAALDRLGRATKLVLDLVDHLDGCNVAIVSCKESLDTETPTGRFVLTIFASLAELERDMITERLTGGRNARGRIDGERGGRLPFGYYRLKINNTKSSIEIDENKAEIVRRIFSERAGGATLQAIADGLNDAGIPSPRNASWHPSSVRAVLQNEDAYKGGYRWKSKQAWPVILD